MINIRNIHKSYKKKEVLYINTLKIRKGECVALLGNNGAGKTTLIKAIVDLIKVDKGIIEINTLRVNETEEWKKKTSIFLSSNLLIPYLTPKEYLYFVGKMKNIHSQEIELFIQENKNFYKNELFRNNKQIRQLSKGNRQKVELMGALLSKNGLILLDEPYANLDISSKKVLSDMITDIHQKNDSTFIISSHNLDDVLKVASRIIILNKGRIAEDIPSGSLAKSEIELILNNEC